MELKINSKKYGEINILYSEEDEHVIKKYTWCVRFRDNKFYALTRIYKDKKGYNIYMHRMLLGNPIGKVVDHINHNTTDNRRENLRICSNKENSRNSLKPKCKTSSKYKGVCFCKQTQKWTSQIMVDGKYIWLGRFKDEIDAAISYNNAAKIYFKEFACLNSL